MSRVRLNLGCGTVKLPGFLNLDANRELEPDVIALVPPLPFKDKSCELVYSSHFLEHLTKDEASRLIAEAWRVLIPGGVFEALVPYAFHETAHQDPTHRSYWVPSSFDYYTKAAQYLGYGLEHRFEVVFSKIIGGREVHAQLRKVVA